MIHIAMRFLMWAFVIVTLLINAQIIQIVTRIEKKLDSSK